MSLDVAIIDYKISNMFSVNSACRYLGLNSGITSDRDEILNARAAVLPGVGAFGVAMEHLADLRLTATIRDFIGSGKPFIGICLGMQLLLSESEEFGRHEGIGIIPGFVRKFSSGHHRVPHIGWNRIEKATLPERHAPAGFSGEIEGRPYMYFVHSFYAEPLDQSVILTRTNYANIDFCSSLVYKNILACQFHPEKSGPAGLRILKNARISQHC